VILYKNCGIGSYLICYWILRCNRMLFMIAANEGLILFLKNDFQDTVSVEEEIVVLSIKDQLLTVALILFSLHFCEDKMFAFLKSLLNHGLKAASKNWVDFAEVEELHGLTLIIDKIDPCLAGWEVGINLRHYLNN